jgi:fumarate reductase (CoM/CoB) subunit B
MKEKKAKSIKVKEMDKEEFEILISEIVKEVEKCVKCGLCKSLCPVFKSLREEIISPRGKAVLFNKKIITDIVYQCTLCKSCEVKCPLGIKMWKATRNAREVLAKQGKDTKTNKEMISNMKKYGNPFGKLDDEIKNLYCC